MPCCDLHPRVMTPQDEQRELDGDPLDWLPPGELERRSDVARFYDGASVFVTGVTGFIGTLILEKLLRSCPGISTIYVLIRDKKGVTLRERLASHLEKEIFNRAREACPDYLRKVVPIAGDCTQPGLGISPADAAELTSKVSVVFHIAATVRFDADLRTAAITNVASTCDLIALIKRMTNLKAFIYMSTAYSNAPIREIDEKFYPPALKSEELLKLIRVMNNEQLAQVLPLMLGNWPNTYTFTKAVAEDAIRTEAAGLPVSIIRPSIVTSTYNEPVKMWVGNISGPTAVAVVGSIGLIHSSQMDGNALVDNVPADMVANATIVCAWDTWCQHSMQALTQQTSAEPLIYNCVSTTRHPISWAYVCRCIMYCTNYPSIRAIWYCYFFIFKRKALYVVCAVVFHLFPAIIADTVLLLRGMKPMLWNIYSRIHGLAQALGPFTTREWTFRDANLVSLLDRLEPADRKLFPFDITDVDFEWHISNSFRGIRLYIFNESFDNLEVARKRYRWLTILHYTVATIGTMLVLHVLWRTVAALMGL